jgi:hypothetical protein
MRTDPPADAVDQKSGDTRREYFPTAAAGNLSLQIACHFSKCSLLIRFSARLRKSRESVKMLD